MGLALEESTQDLEKLESNGINAFVDPKLKQLLKQFGKINIDYISNALQGSGFSIKVGNGSCGSSGCSC